MGHKSHAAESGTKSQSLKYTSRDSVCGAGRETRLKQTGFLLCMWLSNLSNIGPMVTHTLHGTGKLTSCFFNCLFSNFLLHLQVTYGKKWQSVNWLCDNMITCYCKTASIIQLWTFEYLVVYLTMFCRHVALHVGFGKWFLADGTHTNVPLTVDLMDGKIKHRNFFFAIETDQRER